MSTPPGRRTAARAGLAALLLASAGTACSQGDPQWRELRGWAHEATLAHGDVVAYDQVAASTGPGTLSWVTRAAGTGEGLSYWEVHDGEEPREQPLAMPRDPVVIPVDVAGDGDDGFVAAGVARERSNGENTGLLVWRGRVGDDEVRPERLGTDVVGNGAVPGVVTVARAGGTDLVVGAADGGAAAWVAADGGSFTTSVLDLGLDSDLASVDVTGLGDTLVLAGVDASGAGHLWTSTDGEAWTPVEADNLPTQLTSVTVLAPLAGDGAGDDVALAWTAGGEGGEGAPRSGTSAAIQRFDGEVLTDQGVIGARPEDGIAAFALTGAALSPDDRLVVVGRTTPGDDSTVPMVWVRERDDAWEPSTQPQLTGRIGYQFRAVTTTGDDDMVGLLIPWPNHIDVELWRWAPGG